MAVYDGSKVLDAIRSLKQAETVESVLARFQDFASLYGFEKLFVGQLVNPANVPDSQTLFATNWPTELRNQRRSKMAILSDPIALCALRTTRPFRWEEAIQHASRQGRRVVDMARDYGINDGFMFPVHGLYTVPGGVSLGGADLDLAPQEISEVELVSQTLYAQLEELLGPFPYQEMVDLTYREAEVVQFAAAGKTNLEIAQILDIRQDTVKKTLKRASEKLGTTNRAHTVATAIAKRVIFG